MLSGPEIDEESPRAQQMNSGGVGFWPLGLRTAFRDSYKPKKQPREAWTAFLDLSSVRVLETPYDAASYLVFCGPEDAVGTLLGVLKHILASHARACRAKTRETIEARQQGHLPAISGRRRRGRAQPLCARLKEPSQHSPKATTASVRPRRRRGRATPRARATERSHDHARHAPAPRRAPGHRRGHR